MHACARIDARIALHVFNTDSLSVSLLAQPYAPFLRILSTPSLGCHQYSLTRTAHILSILLSIAPTATSTSLKSPEDLQTIQSKQSPVLQSALNTFLKFITAKLNSPASTSRDVIHALSALKPLLTRAHTVAAFVSQPFDGLHLLSRLLERDVANTQLVYSLGFDLWLLSYSSEALGLQFVESGCVRKLVALLKTHVMEKVIRILYAVLAQLLDDRDYRAQHSGKHSPMYSALSAEMIGLSLIQVTDTLSKRKFKDADIVTDMNRIQSALGETVELLSTFEMYLSEVNSGNLQWSPVHKNEIFWRENIAKFDDAIIQRLIARLSADDDTVREVACWDLGEVARFSPDGKRTIAKAGGKAKLMANLQHKNAKVHKAALLAVQKLMVGNWEYLAKSSAGGVASLVAKK